MQVKIVIGTISFMLTMIILGFAALREPARLEEFSAAAQARSIEEGAHIFKSNCVNCHGVNGRSEECYDAGGNQIGCIGLQLNNPALLCTELDGWEGPTRVDIMNWDGTADTLVQSAVAAGRVGSEMPTWSQRYGGPMRDDQVNNVTAFVLNWKSEELCNTPYISFNWPDEVTELVGTYVESSDTTIEAGNPESGAALYVTYGCSGCHGEPDGSSNWDGAGPWLGNIAERGAEIEGYDSAEQYVYRSILYPSEYIAAECPAGPCAGPPSAMPANFPERMATTPQDMADILAYLLGE